MIKNEKLNELYGELNNLKNKISDYENQEMIKEYKDTIKNEGLLKVKINSEISRIQNNCEHPIWYYINNDKYDGKTYYTCKCLECELKEEDRSRNFDKLIFSKANFNFENIQDEYYKLLEQNYSKEIIIAILKEKYEEHKEK